MAGRRIPDVTFSGKPDEDAVSFANYVSRYCTYQAISSDDSCKLFPLLLRDNALYWYDNLSTTPNDWEQLRSKFIEKYRPPSLNIIKQVGVVKFTPGIWVHRVFRCFAAAWEDAPRGLSGAITIQRLTPLYNRYTDNCAI